MVCLQCPLCCNLVHEATTISECLHTFCRSCIYQQLGDGENDSCPICNVSLGCSPLEKLRADHQLDDVCAKLFPVKAKRKNEFDSNTDGDAPPPVRRKERSLSSLGIGAASTSHPGFVSRRTKSVSRRSTAAKDIYTDDDDMEEKKSEKGGGKRHADRDSQGESGSDPKAASSDSSESHEPETNVKSETASDDEHVVEVNVLQALRRERRRGVASQWSQESSKAPPPPLCSVDSSKLEMFLADRSKISATGLLQSQISEATNPSDRTLLRKHGSNDNHFKVPLVSTKTERPGKSLADQSPLAHLAEVAVDQAGKFEYLDGPKARGPRARRGRAKSESGKSGAMGGSLSWQTMLENIRSAAAPQEKKQKPKNLSPAKTLPPTKKPPTVRAAQTNSNKRSQSPSSVIKQEKQNVGFWFSLEAADNQFGENALPQITTRYLRIKDGKLPVSSVKKYLANKLDLQSEAEVEITCRGQPVVPNLPLEKVQGIWLATMPSSMEVLPALKDMNFASQDSKTWAQYKGRSAEDCMMVLTYSRHRRQLLGP